MRLKGEKAHKEKNLIPWWKTDFGQREMAKIEVSIQNNCITQGPFTDSLEKELAKLLDVPYALLTTSGSSALLMALMACDIKPDDEVIVPAYTFIATAQAPTLLGAKVKLVDVEPSRPVIDVEQLKRSFTSKTKAIIAVHINGRAADIEAINIFAVQHDLNVIEDASQALCSYNSRGPLGTQSDIGVFSLGITKLITSGRGGFVVTKKRKIYEKLRKIRNFGISSKVSPDPDILGFNFAFNDIAAAIGLIQIEKIDEIINAHKDIYRFYCEELKEKEYLKILKVDVNKGELPLWVEVLCDQRDSLISLLETQGIQSKAFDPCLCDVSYCRTKGHFEHAQFFANHGLTLPCGANQSKDDLKRVVHVLQTMVPRGKTLFSKKMEEHVC